MTSDCMELKKKTIGKKSFVYKNLENIHFISMYYMNRNKKCIRKFIFNKYMTNTHTQTHNRHINVFVPRLFCEEDTETVRFNQLLTKC